MALEYSCWKKSTSITNNHFFILPVEFVCCCWSGQTPWTANTQQTTGRWAAGGATANKQICVQTCAIWSVWYAHSHDSRPPSNREFNYTIGAGEWNSWFERWHAWSCLVSMSSKHQSQVLQFHFTFLFPSVCKQRECCQEELDQGANLLGCNEREREKLCWLQRDTEGWCQQNTSWTLEPQELEGCS